MAIFVYNHIIWAFAPKKEVMDLEYYSLTLKGIKYLLYSIGMNNYGDVVQECIEKWEKEKDVDMFKNEFAPGGGFSDFRITGKNIPDPEKGLWTAQTFSALVAMSAQLAEFERRKIKVNIEFLRKNFGAANEIMVTGMCGSCGYRTATMNDIDKYISKMVIARKVVDGLESGNLDSRIEELLNVSDPEIEKERRRTFVRLENSNVAVDKKYTKMEKCPVCGSSDIKQGGLLRSVRENVFVALNRQGGQ